MKNRAPYRPAKPRRPALKALVVRRPPPPRPPGDGLGGESVYPAPPPCRHEAPEPCDPPARYDPSRPGPVWEGEGP